MHPRSSPAKYNKIFKKEQESSWNSDIRIEKNKKYLEKLAMFQFGVAT